MAASTGSHFLLFSHVIARRYDEATSRIAVQNLMAIA